MLDTLVINRSSAERSTLFRDFRVYRNKVRKALCWLKKNNRYYANIIIDDNILRILPNEGSIDDLLSQVHDAENRLHHVDDELYDADHLYSETDDTIIQNFISAPFSLHSEDQVINDAFAQIVADLHWPNLYQLMPYGENQADVGSDEDQNNEDEMFRILSHFDSLVTTINPCLNTPVPIRHLYQKANDELCDDLQDYIEFVNKLQKYTRCSPSYCLQIKDGQQYCRFSFPKDNIEHSFIQENNHD
ncbi:hypothetical protein C1646_754725 [Rhizophagus diaphanus]|nr:hypothetical protein C1646_754725 [Rhizophagus diaphanus] [Rhizophagus sp. MUCL 43196]